MTQDHNQSPSQIFQDPAGLLAWLESHAFLPLAEQIAVANRALEFEQTQECRDVLEGYILGLTDSQEAHPEGAPVEDAPRFKRIGHEEASEGDLQQIEEAESPLWFRVWRTLLERYPKVLVLALVLVLYNIGYGGYSVWKWLKG